MLKLYLLYVKINRKTDTQMDAPKVYTPEHWINGPKHGLTKTKKDIQYKNLPKFVITFTSSKQMCSFNIISQVS